MKATTKISARNPRTYYELRDSQVSTPSSIVSFYWDVLKKHRPKLSKVLDLGAGDARFSNSDHYDEYIGIEIDPEAAANAKLNKRSRMIVECAFKFEEFGFDACIGNPPYVRHHDIESPWKENTAEYLSTELDFKLNKHGNLFLYFIALGLLKTSEDGLVAMIVPFEWVSRPSSKALRDLIIKNNWDVSVYRFENSIFKGVLTTACVTVIDKSGSSGIWNYYDVNKDLTVSKRKGVSGSDLDIIAYSNRRDIWTRRGVSPGSQNIFTLTEGQRIHFGLTHDDVTPCVTTLRHFPKHIRQLNEPAFKKHFIDAGSLCWLIKSNEGQISPRLKAYLDSIPEDKRQTYTCLNQQPWYNFEKFEKPELLVHSGFTSFGPKVLINSIGAQAVGSVLGVHTDIKVSLRKLQEYLLGINFEAQVVAQANVLKKIEVRQMNTILNSWIDLN